MFSSFFFLICMYSFASFFLFSASFIYFLLGFIKIICGKLVLVFSIDFWMQVWLYLLFLHSHYRFLLLVYFYIVSSISIKKKHLMVQCHKVSWDKINIRNFYRLAWLFSRLILGEKFTESLRHFIFILLFINI